MSPTLAELTSVKLNADEISKVLRMIAPVETAIVGPPQVRHLAAGGEFANESGGRHLDFVTTLGVLSSVCSLVQVTFAVRIWVIEKTRRQQVSNEFLKKTLLDVILAHEDLAKKTKAHVNKLDEIISIVNRDETQQ